MARTKHQRKKRAKADKAEINPFRAQHGDTVSAGMAVKFTPAIDTLLARKDITQGEYDALKYYREQAGLAERSPLKSNLDRSVSGSEGNGPSLAITSAKIETSRLDRILGSLAAITKAVAVDDMSLTQWTCEQYGSRERYKRDKDGNIIEPRKVVSIEPKGKLSVQMARFELKFAARRMMA